MNSSQPGPAQRALERHRDLDRFLTFVDAVAAIALTLLVLPLADLGSQMRSGQSVASLLRTHDAQFFAFLLSFALIADMWFAQHNALRPFVLLDPTVTKALLVWTFSIVVLPFATELVAGAGDDPLTRVIYFGSLALSVSCHATIDQVARRRPEACDPTVEPRDPLAAWAIVGLLLLGLLLSLLVPAIGYYSLFLLFGRRPAYRLLSRIAVKRRG